MRNMTPPCTSAPEPARVREERLRAVAGLEIAQALGAWRGRSGRRYVVCVRPLAGAASEELDAADLEGAVLIAVARSPDGEGRIVATASADNLAGEGRRRAWLAGLARRGACELHVHRLAQSAVERRTVRIDLAPLPDEGRDELGRDELGRDDAARRGIAATGRSVSTKPVAACAQHSELVNLHTVRHSGAR